MIDSFSGAISANMEQVKTSSSVQVQYEGKQSTNPGDLMQTPVFIQRHQKQIPIPALTTVESLIASSNPPDLKSVINQEIAYFTNTIQTSNDPVKARKEILNKLKLIL